MSKNQIFLYCAGGGKTTKLINRVKDLIDLGVPQNRILIISFTNSSCDDILLKSGVRALTFHGFCYNYLRKDFNIMDDMSIFVHIFLQKFPNLSHKKFPDILTLINSYYIFKNFGSIDEFNLNISKLSEKDQILNREFRNLIEIIEKEKINHKVLFFSDIIHEFLKNIDNFLMEIGESYDHILVDEAQDLSLLQLKILSKMIEEVFFDEDKSFFIVGDSRQSIYDFQGSSSLFFLEFLNQLKDLCNKRQIELTVENKNETFRFGGEILEKIQENSPHKSAKIHGKYQKIEIQEGELEEKIMDIITKYSNGNELKDIMILFDRNKKIIENLQNNLHSLGLNIKIYRENNEIIKGLQYILEFLQTESNWSAAKILQGPFFYLQEPHFYFLSQEINNNYTLYNPSFFDKIKSLRFYPDLLMKFLSNRVISTPINLKLFEELYKISLEYSSFDSFFLQIPFQITIKEQGIQFSTIHSAKGLEAEIVILIKDRPYKQFLYISQDPFFFFYDNINIFTKLIIENQQIANSNTLKNLEYVSLTRAKSTLIEIEIIS